MPIFTRFATWPTYAGYGNWELTIPESKVPGSNDNRIQADQLPATQYAVRYNPLSNNISIPSNVTPIASILPTLSVAGFGFFVLATLINTSYPSSGIPSLDLQPATGDKYPIGIGPPTFNYSISDQLKECIHYAISATIPLWVTGMGTVTPISGEWDVYGNLKYISRCRFKSFRQFSADISSVSYVSGRGTSTWTYKLATTLRNDVMDSLDLSADSVTMDTYHFYPDQPIDITFSGVKVTKIEGTSVFIESGPPPDPSKDYPEGWSGGFFELNKTVLVRNPSTLFCDKNDTVQEVPLGYETSEQQIHDSSTVSGIYVPKDDLSVYLNTKISDPTTTAADLDSYKKSLEYVEGTTIESIPDEDLVYGSFETGDWGKTFLSYVKEMDPSQIVLHIGIGDSPSFRHNMSAGCLSGEFFKHGTAPAVQTYRVSSHIRKNVYQLEVRSRTTKDNLIEVLSTSTDIKTFDFSVDASRMWFINDLTFANQDSGQCNVAAFWGNLSSITTTVTKSDVVLKIEDSFGNYSSTTYLNDRFVKAVSAPSASANFVQKWNDDNREWYLNGENNKGSYKIEKIVMSSTSDSFDVSLETPLPTSIVVDPNQKWWISFDKKFEISGGYSYVSCPYLTMEGAVGYDDQKKYTIILSGIYVGLPFREKLGEGLVVSIVKENVYQLPTDQTIVYLSTASKGNTISMSKNKFANTKGIAYIRNNDPLMALVVRRGSVNYITNICEALIYYGDAKQVDCPVSGVAGGDQTVTLTNDVLDHAITGVGCIPDGVFSSDTSKLVVWEVLHGNYVMGYPSTSGIVSTISTRADTGKYAVEEAGYVVDFKPGTLLSSGKTSYILASNIDNENVVNKTLLTISPRKNVTLSPKLKTVTVDFVPTENLVKSSTSPYVYPMNEHLDCIVYLKNQVWVQSSSANFKINWIDQITMGKRTETRIFDPESQIDVKQDGLFAMSTFDYKRFASGIFQISSLPVPGQSISNMISISESDLYKFPFLVVPNITRCSYSQDKNDLFVVGYSNIRLDVSSTDFNVLCLLFYRVNFLDLFSYPIYAVKGDSGYVFTYCNNDPKYKRIVVEKDCYQEFPEDAPVITDPSLTTGTLSLAVDARIAIIVSHQPTGLVFFLSDDKGASWAYIDDVSLTNSVSGVGSPSIKIYDEQLWLLYTIGSSLYKKIIPVGRLAALIAPCRNKKSSSVKDNSYISLKNSLQSVLDSIKVDFIVELSDQQVSFDVGNEGDLHVIYYGVDGIKSVGSFNNGTVWDYKPVNF